MRKAREFSRMPRVNISQGISTRWIDGDINISLKDDILPYLKNEPIIEINPKELQHTLIKTKRNPKRVQQADLSYPIIVIKKDGKYNKILDGQHRLVKAITNKEPLIKVKILNRRMNSATQKLAC